MRVGLILFWSQDFGPGTSPGLPEPAADRFSVGNKDMYYVGNIWGFFFGGPPTQ